MIKKDNPNLFYGVKSVLVAVARNFDYVNVTMNN